MIKGGQARALRFDCAAFFYSIKRFGFLGPNRAVFFLKPRRAPGRSTGAFFRALSAFKLRFGIDDDLGTAFEVGEGREPMANGQVGPRQIKIRDGL